MTIPLLKVILLGDGNVGKTSLARRFCEGRFEESRVMTIGVDFQTRVVELPGGAVKLSIWDVAGQPHFKTVRENFYRGSLAAALVYDVSSEESLKSLVDWTAEVRARSPQVRLVVVGNKADLADPNRTEFGGVLARKFNAPYVKTSAKTGEGVEEMFRLLAGQALEAAENGTLQ